MHFLVISSPRAEKPSAARDNQKQWWDWLNPLVERGVAIERFEVALPSLEDVFVRVAGSSVRSQV